MSTYKIYGGGENVDLYTTSLYPLAGAGANFAAPGRDRFKLTNRVITLPLEIKAASADAVQTQLRAIGRIIARANLQRRDRRGYPDSFVNELDCYLELQPAGITTGVVMPIFAGSLEVGDSYLDAPFAAFNCHVTLILETTPHAWGAWTSGTRAADAMSAMPVTVAGTAVGGNSGDDECPVRLAIVNPSTNAYSAVYVSMYPQLGTPIRASDGVGSGCIVDTRGTSPGAYYGGSIYAGTVSSTSYVQVGSLPITTDGKPRRYLVLLNRMADNPTNLNWRIVTGGGVVVSPIFKDEIDAAGAFGHFVAGQWTYPATELTGPVDSGGTPTSWAGTLVLQAAKQASGDTTAVVYTDFAVFLPMDQGAHFAVRYAGGITAWKSTDHPNLDIYNDDGIPRVAAADGAPGTTITSVHPLPLTFSGDLPVFYPGNNQVAVVGIRADNTIVHGDTFALAWELRRRYFNI